MSPLLILLPTFFILILIWIYQRYRQLTILKRHGIPGPRPHFIYGNFHELRGKNVAKINEWIEKYGKICGYYEGPVPTLIVTDLELLKRILVKDFKLFAARKGLVKGGSGADSTSTSSVGSYGTSVHRWKEQRSMLTTMFTSQKMKQSVPMMNDAIDSFVETLEEKLARAGGKSAEVDLYEMWQGLTMDTIGRSAFGVLTNVQRNPNDPFLARLKYIFEDNFGKWVNVLMLANIFFPEFISIIYPLRFLQMRIASLFGASNTHGIRTIISKVIEERRKNLKSDNPWARVDLLQLLIDCSLSDKQMKGMRIEQLTASTDDVDANLGPKINGAPKVSKESGHKFSDEEINANAAFFFAAGYETTSTLLGFMTHLLINHPDVQDRVRSEVQELFEKENKLDYNCVNNLPFLDAVINESLRLYTPVTTFVTRVCSVEYKYKDEKSGVDIVIPKGTNILVPVDKLHRDPNVWEYPDKFDPERFMKKNFDSISFQPFGAGN